MSKKSRRHTAPPQSRVLPAGEVPLIASSQQQQQAAKQQQAAIGAKIENLTAQIFVESIQPIIKDGEDLEGFKERASENIHRAIEASLVFAKELWDVEARRMPSRKEAEQTAGERQARPPKPIIE